MAHFPLKTFLHRVGIEYLPFSIVLQKYIQANSSAPQPTPKRHKNNTTKKKQPQLYSFTGH